MKLNLDEENESWLQEKKPADKKKKSKGKEKGGEKKASITKVVQKYITSHTS